MFKISALALLLFFGLSAGVGAQPSEPVFLPRITTDGLNPALVYLSMEEQGSTASIHIVDIENIHQATFQIPFQIPFIAGAYSLQPYFDASVSPDGRWIFVQMTIPHQFSVMRLLDIQQGVYYHISLPENNLFFDLDGDQSAWSSDSQFFILKAYETKGSRIYRVNTHTRVAEVLYSGEDEHIDIGSLKWSDEAGALAVALSTCDEAGVCGAIQTIILIDVQGENEPVELVNLSGIGVGVCDFAWSPSGTHLAFTTSCGENAGSSNSKEVYIIDVAQRDLRRVTDNSHSYVQTSADRFSDNIQIEYSVIWLDDDNLLIGTRKSIDAPYFSSETVLYTLSTGHLSRQTTAEWQSLTHDPDHYFFVYEKTPAFVFETPYDPTAARSAQVGLPSREIQIARWDGAQIQVVRRMTGRCGRQNFFWSPDAQYVAFQNSCSPTSDITILSPNSGRVRVLPIPDSPEVTHNQLIGWVQVSQAEQTTPSETDILRALFADECLMPCFMGIEPGVTTLQEIELYLQQEGISYRKGGSIEAAILEWELPEQEFVTDGAFVPFITVIFSDDIVFKLFGPLNVHRDTVIEVFGSPHQITNSDGVYYMIYPNHNISFILDFAPHSRTAILVSEFSGITYSEITNPPGEPVTQTCVTYGVPPCIAPTATPTPTQSIP